MYIRPRLIWWLLPIFIGLFSLGMWIATLSDKPVEQQKTVMDPGERAEADRTLLTELIEPLAAEREHPFSVTLKDYTLTGTYRGQVFELTGEIEGHKLIMKRSDKDVTVTIDGKGQESDLLPYALYTPYEHATLLKAQLQSITPLAVVDQTKRGLIGYKLSLPPSEVASMLSLWLGPSFPVDDVITQLSKQVSVDYHIWYDTQTKQLKQMVVNLKLDTQSGTKQDQLLFRL